MHSKPRRVLEMQLDRVLLVLIHKKREIKKCHIPIAKKIMESNDEVIFICRNLASLYIRPQVV